VILLRGALALVAGALTAGQALAQELPAAEISSAGTLAGEAERVSANSDVTSAADEVGGEASGDLTGEAQVLPSEIIEISSSGYSRFEINEDGHIVVVYSGGVEFKFRGYTFHANELQFDQAARSANLKGDVRLDSDEYSLSTQAITIDGQTGHASISGRIVGSMVQAGLRFEANGATLTFPPESEELQPDQTQLVLAGDVGVFTATGAELRTDQVALDGATRRFSSAPFTLKLPVEGKPGSVPQVVQVTGTAFGGALNEKGEFIEMNVLGLLAVSAMGRIAAARAVARPDPATQSWQVDVSGSPVQLEYAVPLTFAMSKKQPPLNAGPVLLQAPSATLEVDGEGLKSAALSGGVTLLASGLPPLGNRLELARVSVDRRAEGLALSAGELRLGLDLARLLGIEPVDLADIIK
jgi:hypothetical protein